LLLAAVLILIWVIAAAIFVSTSGLSGNNLSTYKTNASGMNEAMTISTQIIMPETATIEPVLSACAQGARIIYRGSVQIKQDGSIEFVNEGQSIQKINLAGIRYSTDPILLADALKLIRELTGGQTVVLAQPARQDEFDSQSAYLFAGGKFVNYELILQGLASVDLQTPAPGCINDLLQAEQISRDKKLGIWMPKRVPTSTFVPFVTLDASNHPCDCSIRYECSDFNTHDEAQACYNACNDYNSKLDIDRDGIACEGLP